MRCITDCSLIYIDSAEINRWDPQLIDELKSTMRILDLDYILNKINRFAKEKKKRNIALLDAS